MQGDIHGDGDHLYSSKLLVSFRNLKTTGVLCHPGECSIKFIFLFFPPMALPTVQLLCLEQGDRPLEEHTCDFIQLACQTHYPDRSLCVFYHTSLRERSKARIPAGGLKEDFAAFVEWVLVNNNSPSALLRMTSPPAPLASDVMEKLHVPTANSGDQPAAIDKPVPRIRMESVIATETGPQTESVQARELATSSVDTSAPPWLLPPSAPPEAIGHTASPDSLVPLASPWSAVDLLAPSAPYDSAFPPAPPLSLVPEAQPLCSGIPAPPRTLVATAQPQSPG
ncbi:hypothetical protein PO909_013986 [Leuciscus waleckii]